MTKINWKLRNYESKITAEQRDGIVTLIADMIGDNPKIDKAQGNFRLEPGMLPEGMEFEMYVLKAIYAFCDDDLPPTREAVLSYLALHDKFDNLETRLDALLMNKTRRLSADGAAAAVRLDARILSAWVEQEKMRFAVRQAVEALSYNHLSSEEVFDDIMKLMTWAAPRQQGAERVHTSEVFDEFEAAYREEKKRLAEGGRIGPDTPWPSLNELIGSFRKGDLVTWLGATKRGKSTVAMQLAYHVAMECGVQVEIFHLETERVDLFRRYLAGRLMIKPKDMVKRVDIFNDTPYKEQVQAIRNQLKDAPVEYRWCPGASFSEIIAYMADGKARAEAKGLEYMAIIDYFQQIDFRDFQYEQNGAQNAAASKLKSEVQQMRIYCIAFAQSDMKNPESGKPYGGQEIAHRSQLLIEIQRDEEADSDLPVIDGRVKQLDGIGNPLYMHRKGDVDSKTEFKIVRGNNAPTGQSAQVVAYNGYFIFKDLADVAPVKAVTQPKAAVDLPF